MTGLGHRGTPDRLAAVVAFCPADAYPARLPLAFIASHPSARLAAELREAQRVTYFQFSPETAPGRLESQRRRHGEAALLLATSTTPLSRLEELFTPYQPHEGGHLLAGKGRLITGSLRKLSNVFSRIQLADVYNSIQSKDDSDSSVSSHEESNEGAASGAMKAARRRRSRMTKSQLACCGVSLGGVTTVLLSQSDLKAKATAALKSCVVRRRGQGANGTRHGRPKIDHDLGSKQTLQEWLHAQAAAEKKPCGLSTHLLDTLEPFQSPYLFPSSTVAPDILSLPEVVAFHESSGKQDVVDDHRHKLKTAVSTMVASQLLSKQKERANGCRGGGDVMLRAVFVATQGTDAPVSDVVLGVSRWWLQRPVKLSELPRHLHSSVPTDASVHPPLVLKYVSDAFASPSWLRAFSFMGRVLCQWLAQLCSLLLFFVGMAFWNQAPARGSAKGTRSVASSLAEMRELGAAFSSPEPSCTVLLGLDVSRTSFTGSHLLALTDGAASNKSFLRSLDMSGCGKLKVHHPQPPTSEQTRKHNGPIPFRSMCAASDAGLALGRLTYQGGLTWLNVAGSSFDHAVVECLGLYSLLHEALSRPSSSSHSLPPSRASLVAINMTMCRSVASLNGLAFVPSLVQVLAPFSDMKDASLRSLDGHNFLMKLASAVARMKADTCVGTPELNSLARLAALKPADAPAAPGDPAEAHTQEEAAKALACRFSSHLYHLDLTFSIELCDVNELLHTQRVLQFLNLSHTHTHGAGLGTDVRAGSHEGSQGSSRFLCPAHKLVANAGSSPPSAPQGCYAGKGQPEPFPSPLRVLVCDPCDYVGTLTGLTPTRFPSLEKLYLRSGSLSEDGVAAAFAPSRDADAAAGPFAHLQLLDLSYCDKLHDVAVLSRFPALHTLILDNTEVMPEGLRHLRSPHATLKVLSLRYCPEVLPILRAAKHDDAARLRLFRQHICNLPSLEGVVVEEE